VRLRRVLQVALQRGVRGGAVRARWAPFVAGFVMASTLQCGDDTTGRRRITFDVYARGMHLAGDTSTGWQVRVESAFVVVGPLRWYEGAPLFGRRSLGWGGVAWAHPGHYVPGGALADIGTRALVDLTSTVPISLGRANGVSGTARSAHIELHPPEEDLGPARAALEGQTLVLRGTAQRGDARVRFRAALRVDVNIEGIPASASLDGAPGRWEVGIDVLRWLDRVDFSMLPPPAEPDGVSNFPEEGQPSNALYRGVVSGAAYRFRWIPTTSDGGAD